jgi:acyl transferase domain-containing protein/acyl carrier protein
MTADPDAVRRWLITALAEARGVPAARIDTGRSFHDHGLSSSEALSVCGELEDWLGRPVSPTVFYRHPTIDLLAQALATPSPRPVAPPGAEPRSPDTPVCVVGLGCRFPGGADSPDLLWRNLIYGTHAASEVPADRWDAEEYFDPDPTARLSVYTTRGGFLAELAGFDADFFGISPAEAVRMDPQQRLLLEVTWAALENAGIAPDRLRGSRTGVFVGMMASQEYGRVQTDRDAESALADPYFGYGTAPSVTAGRLSYLLDLRGPSLCVDTACSSSLLAVHLAAQSLRRGECDLAVVGGVSAVPHPGGMVQACRAHMLAPDGRCKTFDAAADGFLMSEGCGVVVLERGPDAESRGHRVLATVRGSAVGQDGRSNGMTAPNPAAQEQVIRDALAAARVAPGQIGYLETHGSGTRLGDAVEVGALQQVFSADRDPATPLVLGAVKTNLGHLLGAAGIAGLIKAVLALRHGTVPGNLHLTDPNPAIDWSRCPVLLPERPTEWPVPGPRLAGVSSFGWSGTNVHVVLQAGPEPAPAATEPDRAQLLRLSAASRSGLARVAAELRETLTRRPELDLADVAHTLRVGRAELSYRMPVVCSDRAGALAALGAVTGESATRVAEEPRTGTAFLFPGTGDHYAGMGHGLYTAEPAFRDAFDECANLLLPLLRADLRELVYEAQAERRPAAVDLAALVGRAGPEVTGPLDRVEFAHCAVFAVEYALARLWLGRGVRPDALFGYSLGEYVAACLAGVFTLPEALRIVALRAKLIGSLPEGAMLAVPLSASEVDGVLPEGVSVAAYNGPAMTVLGGPVAAIDRLAAQLAARDVVHRLVNNGHALHTTALDPIRAEVAELVGQAHPRAPELPVMSSRTGDWLTGQQATDPGYWAAQMCEPVRFDQGLRALAERLAGIALEIGPGQTLSGLVGQVLGTGDTAALRPVPTLRPVTVDCADREFFLRAAGRHWAGGGRGEPDAEPATGRVLTLPTYPFEHQRFWPASVHNGVKRADGKLADRAAWCHVPVWRQSVVVSGAEPGASVRWLVFTDNGDTAGDPVDRLLDEVATGLSDTGAEVVWVAPGARFRRLTADAYTIDPAEPADYRALVDDLRESGRLPARILHAWSASAAEPAVTRAEPRFFPVLNLIAALGRHAPDVRLHLLSTDAQDILPGELADPWQASAIGLARTVDQEFPGMRVRLIDLAAADAHDQLAPTVSRVLAELRGAGTDEVVAFRGGRRWVRAWQPTPIGPAEDRRVWRTGGSYLITGGFGELGLALARELAARHQPKLALLGRSALPGRDEWDDETVLADEQVRRRITAVRELESLGAQVLPLAVDIADPVRLSGALAEIRRRFGALHGVIHAAGVPATGLVALKTRADAERVFRPKVDGALALHTALRGQPLDFLALYSSSVVAFGGLGESDYCAANGFLGAFAHRLRAQGVPATAIDWGPWQRDAWTPATGDPAWARLRALRDRYGITDAEGVDLLTRVLAADAPEVLVVPQDPDLLAARWRELTDPVTEPAAEPEPQGGHPRPQLRTPYVAPRTALERRISEIWRQYVGVDRVGVDDQFFELGGNSLIGLTIVARLAKELDVPLTAADLFEAPTPAALAGIVAGRLGAAMGGNGNGAGRAVPRTAEGSRRGAQRRRLAEAAALRRTGGRGGRGTHD